MSVTVVSCVYGDYARFFRPWQRAIDQLDRKPDNVIVTGNQTGDCPWRHPQAFFLQRAITAAETDWVWIVDIDDLAMSDALDGLDDVTADVWMAGYLRSDGEVYVPPPLTAREVYDSPRNLIPAGSFIRTEAFRDCGGYFDVALQDWALWRRLAENGATFQSSGRAQYRYNRHPATRGETELTLAMRTFHFAEMLAAETGLEITVQAA